MGAIEQNRVDAALLDMELCGEKSFPVAERLKQQSIPFTFLSGHGELELPQSLRDRRTLSKPAERAALLTAIDRMCASD